MKHNKNILRALGAIALVSLVACNGKSDEATRSAGTANENLAAVSPAVDSSAVVAPVVVHSYIMTAKSLMVDGVVVNRITDSTFADYPVLAAQVSELEATTHVTEAGSSVELFDDHNERLMLISLPADGGAGSVANSRANFSGASIPMIHAPANANHGPMARLTFNLRQCISERACKSVIAYMDMEESVAPGTQGQNQGKVPAQDQGKVPAQDQGKVPAQDQGKVPAQDQGKVPAQDQGKVPAQDQGKTPAPVPAQDQGKTPAPVPAQDQGKVPAQDQGKVPAQDPGKTPAPVPAQDQGKVPAQDQGKTPAPVPAQDQGKVPAQDQGKTPAPVPAQDQGKVPAQDQGKTPSQGQSQGKKLQDV